MTARTWQMVAAFVAIGVMIVTLVVFGHGDGAPPSKPVATRPEVAGERHPAEAQAGALLAPLQPFVNAKVGDWIAVSTTTQLADGHPTVTHSLLAIEAADDTSVTIVRTERQASLEPPTITRDQRPRQGLTIDQLVGNHEATLAAMVVSDEPHEVGGRSFACKKLAFATMDVVGGGKLADVEMWIAADVPVDGLVEIRQNLLRSSLQVTTRLLAFGTTGGPTWGTKPDGL